MSDAIDALNKIVYNAGQRGQDGYQRNRDDENPQSYEEYLEGLLEFIAEVAGDSLEDHVAARDRAKPRKARVYKQIVEEIAVYFCDQVDTTEGAIFAEEGVREILVKYGINTHDFEGKEVQIV